MKWGDFCALALACTPVQAAGLPFELIPIALQRGRVEIANTFYNACELRDQDGQMSSSQQHAERPQPQPRSAYAEFVRITTRWADNDAYGHVNNVVYYSWFDTAVNRLLIDNGLLDLEKSSSIGLVVETQCHYFAPVSYPQDVDVGVRVAHLGKSSVRYELAIFVAGASQSAACGHFVHVYVDRSSRRPVALPDATRLALDRLRLR